jgi:hypothetical protein
MRSVDCRSVFWWLALVLAASSMAPAQARAQADYRRHLAVGEMAFNDEDFLAGGSYRYQVAPEFDLGLFVSFLTRTEGEISVQEVRPHFLIQREEDRSLVSAGVDKNFFPAGMFDLFVAAGAGYTFATFEGTSASPNEGWTVVARGGAIVRFHIGGGDRISLRAGYQYADLRTVPKSFGYVAVGGEF